MHTFKEKNTQLFYIALLDYKTVSKLLTGGGVGAFGPGCRTISGGAGATCFAGFYIIIIIKYLHFTHDIYIYNSKSF